MGPFGQNAQRLWNAGVSVVPIAAGQKGCFEKDWSRWCRELATDGERAELLAKWSNAGVGVAAGPASGLAFIDCDLTDGAQADAVLAALRQAVAAGGLWVRRGSKGWAVAIRWRPEMPARVEWNAGEAGKIELLADHRQVVAPPSIHPNGTAYRLDDDAGDPCGLPLLLSAPDLGLDWLAVLDRVAAAGGGKRAYAIKAGTRDTELTRRAGVLAGKVRRGVMSLRAALDEIEQTIRHDTEPGRGGVEPFLRKFPAMLVKLFLKDVQQYGPPAEGWDDGLSIDEKEALGVGHVTAQASAWRMAASQYVYHLGLEGYLPFDDLRIAALRQRSAISAEFAHMGVGLTFGDDLLTYEELNKVFDHGYWPDSDCQIIEEKGRKYLNLFQMSEEWHSAYLYRGTEIADVADRFYDLVASVVPEERERNHLLDWMAYSVQNPLKRINHMILLGGEHQGTGKSTIGQTLSAVFGFMAKDITNSEFNSDFNGWIDGCAFGFVEELFTNKSSRMAAKLKEQITLETIRVHDKHVKRYEVDNMLKVFACTNRTDAMRLDEHDRRVFVYFTKAKPRSERYWREYRAWLAGGGIKAVAESLLRRDVSTFNPYAPPPMTDSKKAMIRQTESRLKSGLRELVEGESWPFNKRATINSQIIDAARRYNRRFNDYSDAKILETARELLPDAAWPGRSVNPVRVKVMGQTVRGRPILLDPSIEVEGLEAVKTEIGRDRFAESNRPKKPESACVSVSNVTFLNKNKGLADTRP